MGVFTPRTRMLENNRKIVSKKIDFLRQYAIYDGEDKNSEAFAKKQQEAYDFYSALFDVPDKNYSKASKALSEIINDFTSCVIDNSKVRRNAFNDMMSELELSK